MIVKTLLRIGLIRIRDNGKIRWPVYVAPKHHWISFAKHPIGMTKYSGVFYVFRNVPGVIKWKPGRMLPRRWGFGFFGLLEFGDRG